MKGYKDNIEKSSIANENFRQVEYTAPYSQVVLMSLKPGEDIGDEVHGTDQFFRFEAGQGKLLIDDHEYEVADGDAAVVPAGAKHNVVNTGSEALKLYTIYCPPHHRHDVVHATKDQALADEEEFDGHTSE
ncbi:MAG: cupin domain-containing protein [Candidatus Komeilibacteria bacterium]|nr:cupin domain-containing protein [Candidatus Komeilibacteria bacterium]